MWTSFRPPRLRKEETVFVEDFMTTNPKTVKVGCKLAKAVELMRKHRIRHLPVLDESGRLVGIVTDRDVRTAVEFDRTLRDKLTVAEVMTSEPTTIGGEATLNEALDMLIKNRFGSLPVMRAGTMIGILTRSDLLRAFRDALRRLSDLETHRPVGASVGLRKSERRGTSKAF